MAEADEGGNGQAGEGDQIVAGRAPGARPVRRRIGALTVFGLGRRTGASPPLADGAFIDIDGAVVRLKVNARARRVSLRLDVRRQEMVATAPSARRLNEAAAFAQSRAEWISACLRKAPERQSLAPGRIISLEGAPLRLERAAMRIRARFVEATADEPSRLIASGDGDAFGRAVARALGLADLDGSSTVLRDWGRGCGRPNHAKAGSRRSPDFRRTGRAAKGRRKVRCRPRRRERETRSHDGRRGVQGHQLRRSDLAESANVGDLDRRGQLEVPSGRSRLAGRAPPTEPSWGCLSRRRSRNRTPQRRANASASAWFRTPRRAVRSSFPRSCWKSELRRRYSQAKPGASSDRSSSYAPGVRQSARLIGVVSTGKWPISRPVGMISARAAAQYAPASQRVLPWRQGTGSRLVWRAPAQQVPVAVLFHPTGSGQVRVPGPARSIGLACRIDMEDDQGNLAPVSAFRVRIKQTQIRHEVLFVVAREDAGAGSGVGNRRVKWWRLHRRSLRNPLPFRCVTDARAHAGMRERRRAG